MPQPCFTLSFERLRPGLHEGTGVSMAAGLFKEISGHFWDVGGGRGCKQERDPRRDGKKGRKGRFPHCI